MAAAMPLPSTEADREQRGEGKGRNGIRAMGVWGFGCWRCCAGCLSAVGSCSVQAERLWLCWLLGKLCPTALGPDAVGLGGAVMHSSAPLQMSVSRESPYSLILTLSCFPAGHQSSVLWGKSWKKDCGTSKLDPKTLQNPREAFR